MIVVDWVHGSTGAYYSAVDNVTQLALSISHFISKLLVRSCAFPVGKHGHRIPLMQTIRRVAPNLLSPGAGQVNSLFQSEHCVVLKIFFFFTFPLSLSPAFTMPLFFFFFLILGFYGKTSQLSAASPAQGEPDGCLGLSQVCASLGSLLLQPFFFFFFQKAEGVGFGAILYLLWVSDTLPSSWKSPAVPYFAHAQHS